MKMKGWNDFLVLLTVAIGLIVVLLIFGAISGPVKTGEVVTVASLSFGKIGIVANIPSKIIQIPDFVSGELQSEVLRAIPQLEFKTSIFGSNRESFEIEVPEWLINDMSNAMVTAGIHVDSNKLGNFVLKWNGKELYNGKPEDLLNVYIPEQYIKQSNTIEMYAESPGLAFWASNYYLLKNIEIVLEYGPAKIIPLTLNPSDIESFDYAEVRFYASAAVPLLIKVNGKEIYNKVPRGIDKANFGLADAPLRSGPNLISFNSERALKVKDVEVRLFLVSGEASKTRNFNLSTKAYNLLRMGYRGRIDVQVTKIERPGSLKLKLNGKTLPLDSIKEGINSAYFSLKDVEIGSNELELSGTGSFDVQEVRVLVEG